MKYLYTFLFATGLIFQSSAQTKFSLGYVYSLESSFMNKYYFDNIEMRMAYTVGINARIHFHEKLSFTYGLQYSVKGFNASRPLYADFSNTPVDTFHTTYSFRYLEVPLLLNYQCPGSSRVSLFTSAGFVPGFFIYASSNAPRYSGSPDVTNNSSRTFILSGYTGIGTMIKISDSFSFLVQPNFKYSLTKMNKPPVTSPGNGNFHPYSIGLLCGVYYQFK
jgi:hypothetical protein